MTEQTWILPLKTAAGQPCGFARVRQSRDGADVNFSFRNGMLLRPEDTIYLLSEHETAALKKDGCVPLTAPASGILILRGSSCICQGATHNAKIDLEQEKTKLRMAHYASEQKNSAHAEPAPLPPVPDGPSSDPRASNASEPERDSAAKAIRHTDPAGTYPRPAYYNQPACGTDAAACGRPASDGLPRPAPGPACIPQEAAQENCPGNSRALQGILQRASILFEPETQPQTNGSVCGSVQTDTPPARSGSKPPPSLWEDEVAKILSEDPPAYAPKSTLVRTTPAQTSALAIPNPFQNAFPHSSWKKVFQAQGQGWFLQGEMRRGSETIHITAIPGEYRAVPPRHFQGFSRYIKTHDGGYWVRCTKGRPS